jgi:hypothetical protein
MLWTKYTKKLVQDRVAAICFVANLANLCVESWDWLSILTTIPIVICLIRDLHGALSNIVIASKFMCVLAICVGSFPSITNCVFVMLTYIDWYPSQQFRYSIELSQRCPNVPILTNELEYYLFRRMSSLTFDTERPFTWWNRKYLQKRFRLVLSIFYNICQRGKIKFRKVEQQPYTTMRWIKTILGWCCMVHNLFLLDPQTSNMALVLHIVEIGCQWCIELPLHMQVDIIREVRGAYTREERWRLIPSWFFAFPWGKEIDELEVQIQLFERVLHQLTISLPLLPIVIVEKIMNYNAIDTEFVRIDCNLLRFIKKI